MENKPDKKAKPKSNQPGVELDNDPPENRQAVLVRDTSSKNNAAVPTTIKPSNGTPRKKQGRGLEIALVMVLVGLAIAFFLILTSNTTGNNTDSATKVANGTPAPLVGNNGLNVGNLQTANAIATMATDLDLSTAVPLPPTPTGPAAQSSGDSSGQSWPNSGLNPGRTRALDAKINTPLNRLWAKTYGQDLPGSPVIVGDTIYLGSDYGALYAIDIKTGDKKWFFTSGPIVDTPAVAGNTIYFGSQNGFFYAVDLTTQKKKWDFPTLSPITGSPQVINGAVYFGGQDGSFYVVDANTGQKRCALSLGQPFNNGVTGSPAIVNNLALFGVNDGRFIGMDTATCKVKWTYEVPGKKGIASSPAVANGVAYFGADDGNVHALDINTGAQKWEFKTGAAIRSSAAVAGGKSSSALSIRSSTP